MLSSRLTTPILGNVACQFLQPFGGKYAVAGAYDAENTTQLA